MTARAADIAARLAAGDRTAAWPHPIYAGLRRGGRRLWHGWSDGPDAGAWLAAHRAEGEDADLLELYLPTGMRPLDAGERERPPAQWTGVYGLEVRRGCHVARMAPSHMVATNLRWGTALARGLKALHEDELPAEVFRVEGECLVVKRHGDTAPIAFRRAGTPVESAGSLPDLARLLGGWLVRATRADGRLTYKYWPSRGATATSDNAVRQMMGSVALGRYARWSGDGQAAAAARRNLDGQLSRLHEILSDGSGAIVLGGSAKLGAAAMAALAIIEDPRGERHEGVLDSLILGIERLWQTDGSFRTFHFPRERNDNQNFYPGEAALFWAELYARRRDPVVLARLLRTLDHYRDWHRRNRNPAFVPWHTRAHVALFEATGMTDRLPFAFEMIDWLLPMQQWDDAPAPDMRGRFYDPRHPEYGPPHAASTGAYLEGIAAAARAARRIGDATRATRYETALARGFRNIRQLAFADDMDLFQIARPRLVLGGVRTEVYDNTIRVDNVQHALTAVLEVLMPPGAMPNANQ